MTVPNANMSILDTVPDVQHPTVLSSKPLPLSMAPPTHERTWRRVWTILAQCKEMMLDQAVFHQTLALFQTLLLTSPAHHSRYTHYLLQAWLIAPPNPPPVPHSL
jgi:hypothetical protein